MSAGEKNFAGNPAFWLNIGAEEVYSSFQSRRDAIDRLQKTIAWVFSLYTSITFASVIFGTKKDFSNPILLLFACAFLFLIAAYWLSMLSSFSRIENFYATAESSIRASFIKSVKRGTILFTIAVISSGIGTLFYTAALCGQFSATLWNTNDKAREIGNSEIEIKSHFINNQPGVYAFDITSRNNTWHEMKVVRDYKIEQTQLTDTIILDRLHKIKCLAFRSDTIGKINFVLANLPQIGTRLIVTRIDSLKKGQLLNTQTVTYNVN